jgi:pyruvate formate lyase activating enzyme
MPDGQAVRQTPLQAKSPYELRVNLGRGVPDSDVRTALATGDMGFLHSFTTGSTVDGPGVRAVAWTTGCMMRCLYCHNPDTWTMSNGIPVTIAQASEELRKYRHGLKVMSGGFTLSGGEPLMQHRFAVKLLTAAKSMGIHTALDTNGLYGDRLSDAELETIDLVLLDLKMSDPERHRRLTGMDVAPTLKFAERLAHRGRPIWVRYVLVPGFTDNPQDIAETAAFAATLGCVRRVDVLPFHQMGKYKWKNLGLTYTLEDVEPPSTDAVARACAVFRATGLTAY